MGKDRIGNKMTFWDKVFRQFKTDFNITPHFKYSEFHCKDGTVYPYNWVDDRLLELCEQLEIIREFADAPIIINSGYRTYAYNKEVGGVDTSMHLLGKAVDIRAVGVPISSLYKKIYYLRKQGRIKKGGIGFYSTFIHYDTRGKNVTWRKR